jgi:hypothetical protein
MLFCYREDLCDKMGESLEEDGKYSGEVSEHKLLILRNTKQKDSSWQNSYSKASIARFRQETLEERQAREAEESHIARGKLEEALWKERQEKNKQRRGTSKSSCLS